MTDSGKHPRREAPIYADTFRLCEWLLARLGEDDRVLSRSLCTLGLNLLDDVTSALRERDRPLALEDADSDLACLRSRLRLAGSIGVLTERQLLFALELADTIGRQIGGWRRHLGVA